MSKLQLVSQIWQRCKIALAITILTLTLIVVNNQPVSSQSITGINAEISSLRSRISRLESEVRNFRSSSSAPGVPAQSPSRESISGTINNPPMVNDRVVGRSDPLFERLATLLIELKEDVRDIENRLVILEEQSKSVR